jgi:hypothetical protein
VGGHRQDVAAAGTALVVIDDGPSVVLRRRDGRALASGVAGIRLPLTMAEYRRSRLSAARTMYALASSPAVADPVALVGRMPSARPDSGRPAPKDDTTRRLRIVGPPAPRVALPRQRPRRAAAGRDGPASDGDGPASPPTAAVADGVGPTDPRRPLLDLLAEAIAVDLLRGGGKRET